MTKSTSWFGLLNAVLATIGTTGNRINDRKTYNVMASVAADLMTAKGIGGKLLDVFVRNIEIRVGVVPAHGGRITLTRNQKRYARQMGWNVLQDFETLYAKGQACHAAMRCAEIVKPDDLAPGSLAPADDFFSDERFIEAYPVIAAILTDAITQPLRTDYASIQHPLRGHYADLTREAAEKLAFWLSMKWNETKENHGARPPATQPVPAPPDAQADAFAHDGQSTELPEHDADRDVGGSHSLTGSAHRKWQGENAAPANDDRPARRRSDAITIWVKPNPEGELAASGFVELDGAKYALCFTNFYHALDRITATDTNADWLDFISRDVADEVLALERASVGIAARSTMSAFFHEKNTRGTKAPEHDHAAIVLQWAEDKPVVAMLVIGEQLVAFDMKQETPMRFNARFALENEAAA